MLVIFAGLPGVGKTTLARKLALALDAVYLRIDSLEQGMRNGGLTNDLINGSGYMAACMVAKDNLLLGRNVILDSVNPWELTREMYRNVAREIEQPYLDVHVVCSDQREHQRRVETRVADIQDFILPTWKRVIERDYHSFPDADLTLDTSQMSVDDATALILKTVLENQTKPKPLPFGQ